MAYRSVNADVSTSSQLSGYIALTRQELAKRWMESYRYF